MFSTSFALMSLLMLLAGRSCQEELLSSHQTSEFSEKCFGMLQPLLQDIAIHKEAIDKCQSKDEQLRELQGKYDEVQLKLVETDSQLRERVSLMEQQEAMCELYRNNSKVSEELLKTYRAHDEERKAQISQKAAELQTQTELLGSCISQVQKKDMLIEKLQADVQLKQLEQRSGSRNLSDSLDQILKLQAEPNYDKEQWESCRSQLESKDEHVEQLQAEIRSSNVAAQELRSNLSEKEIQIVQLRSDLQNISVHYDILGVQYSTLKMQADVMESQIDNLQSELNRTELELSDYRSRINRMQPLNCAWFGNSSGIEIIWPPGGEPFHVLCDSRLAGPGWTVIQRRYDGSENFYRNWSDYRQGFGKLGGEFFVGMEKLYRLTMSQTHELYVHLESFNNSIYMARYSGVYIGSESESYALKFLGNYSGNATDGFHYARNRKFSTFDADNDKDAGNCAEQKHGAWWYDRCGLSNLNGMYSDSPTKSPQGIWWLNADAFSFKAVQMMLRPIAKYASYWV